MSGWLWSQFQDFALGIAAIFWGAVILGLIRWAITDPRGLAARVCGALAGLSAILALLWLAHLSDKYALLP